MKTFFVHWNRIIQVWIWALLIVHWSVFTQSTPENVNACYLSLHISPFGRRKEKIRFTFLLGFFCYCLCGKFNWIFDRNWKTVSWYSYCRKNGTTHVTLFFCSRLIFGLISTMMEIEIPHEDYQCYCEQIDSFTAMNISHNLK